MNKYVLDSSAVLAVIQKEPGAEFVARNIEHCVISAVNLCEVVGKLARDGIGEDDSYGMLENMILEVIPFDRAAAFSAGRMILRTLPYGLSLGDRACLATAAHLKLEAITADKVWTKLKIPVKIKVIR